MPESALSGFPRYLQVSTDSKSAWPRPLTRANQDGNFNYQPRDTPEDLPAGTSPWPIESQCCVAGAPQPLCDFFGLEGPVFEFEVTIEQLGNFFCGARFPDLVQRA